MQTAEQAYYTYIFQRPAITVVQIFATRADDDLNLTASNQPIIALARR
jgi:hypothetical protein